MVAPCFIEDTLDCLRQQGVRAEPLLAQVGLPAIVAEPIPAEQYGELWRLMARATDDEFFGLGARPMRSGSFALLCHAILTTTTLEHALRRALRFLRVVLDDPHGQLTVENGLAQIVLKDAAGLRPAFAYRTFWIIVHGVSCWIVGRRIPIVQVDFRCAAPTHDRDYRQFFGAPVSFDQPETRLVFNADYLKLPTIRDEEALREFLTRAPANILVRYRHDAGLSASIRARLTTAAPDAWPSFEALAERMRLGAPTLRRRLRLEGQTYRSIKDELRRGLAIEALLNGHRNVADLANDLGFSEPSAFHRAFRKWTGKSPALFRQDAAKTPPAGHLDDIAKPIIESERCSHRASPSFIAPFPGTGGEV
jgi:AraC-like DNA-binding protein